MRKTFIILSVIAIAGIGLAGNILNYSGTPLTLKIPAGWPKPQNIFANNPLTEEGFELGRKLFYDGSLSRNGQFACASCHQQFSAFSNREHQFSHGFENSFTTRNAPPLFNLAWMKAFNWDGGANHIEVQALVPLTATNEMAGNLDSALAKIRKDTAYKRMFTEAFGSSLINSQRMLKALAQFTGSLISSDAKYDKVKRGQDTFTVSEEKGYRIYKANCSACHTEPLFTDGSYRNNGLAMNSYLCDLGRMNITGKSGDSLKFKVPSLRNIEVSFPYMHDGRIYTLSHVIDHYTHDVLQSKTLDSVLMKKIVITESEKLDLQNFLYTLTDTSFLKNPRYAAPKNAKLLRSVD